MISGWYKVLEYEENKWEARTKSGSAATNSGAWLLILWRDWCECEEPNRSQCDFRFKFKGNGQKRFVSGLDRQSKRWVNGLSPRCGGPVTIFDFCYTQNNGNWI